MKTQTSEAIQQLQQAKRSNKRSDRPVRVRIAPSPTGNLHIGTARTALFNWLFARHLGGTFLLRIEDTDRERSKKEFEEDIISGLEWLGLTWDEDLVRQSERLDLYEKYLQQLLAEHKAYYCFCTKEELEAQRQSQEAAGQAPKYSGKCRSLTEAQVESKKAHGEGSVIRLKVAPEKIKFHDLIRGTLEFDNALSGDIVIAKNLREPLYNFSVVIDDFATQISHVIRGEDHIANTPKQIAVAQALNLPKVEYAHLPLILNPDRSKMSKRFNATNVREYRAQGYLPEALVNFLALLGWHPVPEPAGSLRDKPRTEKEFFTIQELVELFDISRVQKGGAVFNLEKLNFINAQYLKHLSADQLASLLSDDAFSDPAWRKNEELFKRSISLIQERIVKLGEYQALAGFLFTLPAYDSALLVWKKSTAAGAKENLAACRELLLELPDQLFTGASLESKLMALAERRGKGDVLWPLRVAVSGQAASPPPAEIIEALGKTETLRRIDVALAKLR